MGAIDAGRGRPGGRDGAEETPGRDSGRDSEQSAEFGRFLQERRLRAGLTQEALAERAGLGRRSIQGLERGESRPRRETLQRLARALDLAPLEQVRFARGARSVPRRRMVDTPGRIDPPVSSRDESAPRHNLPARLTSFVGRERELAEVQQLLTDTRLLTLTGPGGCGKTRLALRAAGDLVVSFPDGVWFVDLAPLNDPALVPHAVAAALGAREVPGQDQLATLAEVLRARHVLLVLDNCEHLVAACARLAEQVLRAAALVRILATSRERLRAEGETIYLVSSLAAPPAERLPGVDEGLRYPAVRLFVDRAGSARPGFALTPANFPDVAQICARLDGIPLALELAAARVGSVSVEQIAGRLDDRFRLLTTGLRTSLPRQRTLRAALDWSYDLLAEQERVLFRRLAVFAGGWTLEAAEGICAGEGIDERDVFELLTGLIDQCLVQIGAPDEQTRYRLLETVRQYAHEQLVGSGELVAVRGRHRDWYLALAERAERELRGPDLRVWADRLGIDEANLRAALDWSAADPAGAEVELRLATALGWFWQTRNRTGEMRRRLGHALDRAGEDRGERRARALRHLGLADLLGGDHERAGARLREGLALARDLGDRYAIADAFLKLAWWSHDGGDFPESLAYGKEALTFARESGHRLKTAQVLAALGLVLQRMDGPTAARPFLEEGLALGRAVGHAFVTVNCLVWLADGSLGEGDLGRARALLDEALAHARASGQRLIEAVPLSRLGDLARAEGDDARARSYFEESLSAYDAGAGPTVWMLVPLVRIAGLSVARGQSEKAARLFGMLNAFYAAAGMKAPYHEHREYAQDLRATRAALGDDGFAAAWAEGQAMTLEQAVACAVEQDRR